MLRAVPNGVPRVRVLGRVAELYAVFLRENGGHFACMQAIENDLGVPRARAEFVRYWFGRRKGFSEVELVTDIVDKGAAVPGAGSTDIAAALRYGNHHCTAAYSENILKTIFDDVRFGRMFVFPRHFAPCIPGLRLSPIGVVVSPTKIRIIHDLTFELTPGVASVNAGTEMASARKVELGKVLRDIVWRILWLRRHYGPNVQIVLSKVDVTDAFRQVAVQWSGAPAFGFSCGEFIVVDRRLQFGWKNCPGNFCAIRQRWSILTTTHPLETLSYPSKDVVRLAT